MMTFSGRILIIDAERGAREKLAECLTERGYDVTTTGPGDAALALMHNQRFHVLLVDVGEDGEAGLSLLKSVKASDPDVVAIMMAAYGSIRNAVDCMREGAHDYLLKPIQPDKLCGRLHEIMARRVGPGNGAQQGEYLIPTDRFESMIAQSVAMQRIFQLIQDVAPMDSTILITGETGTGKELAAKAIHSNSSRRNGPFVTVNCGAVPENLMESELFGYQKGAFTSAAETKKGRLELANGGTLFLDEIGDISMRMQVDLLRVLENRVFYRVGGTQPLEADFRVIAATNRDLKASVATGDFREDFYYRLNVISFEMPPLRERKEDIPLLAEHFLLRYIQETGKAVRRISRGAMDEMMLHEWPGNIRELRNAIERAVVIGKSDQIVPEELPFYQPECPPPVFSGSLRQMEQAHITHVLVENDWNMSRCARLLGIDRSTLYNKIKRYNIQKSK
ncbi:MAG: sigma-54 dependent transcriptional regulator [Desulfobacterales bacterium]|nr:sigma-54 dependent transcriptional regulator [Desulfobacterales bacterium]MDJ0873998.1 sigma-54 dependent transcriptional regulator [Desulfobacterales bacterium]